jgi:hypothetical protein
MLGFERLIAELIFGRVADSPVDHELEVLRGRPGRCLTCGADAVVGRLGPLTFLVFFLGMAVMILGAIPFVFSLSGFVLGNDDVGGHQGDLGWLAFAAMGAAVIGIGAALIRGARALAHRNPLFPVRCLACRKRWRQSMPPGTVSLAGTIRFAKILWVLAWVASITWLFAADCPPPFCVTFIPHG